MTTAKFWGTKLPTFTPQDKCVPLLPGNNWHDDPIMKGSHKKAQHMTVQSGVPMVVSSMPHGYNPPEYQKIGEVSQQAFPQRAITPPWLTSKNILKFSAYFKEPVVESAIETIRVRKCAIYFYTEDKTIMIREVNVQNSGMTGGVLLRRMRLPMPGTKDGFADFNDICVGQEIMVHGKVFKIIGCDSNTRNHLEAEGITMPENESWPDEDDHFGRSMAKKGKEQSARKMLNYVDMEMKRHHEYGSTGRVTKPTPSQVEAAQKFYTKAGQTLKFFCIWDDRDSPHGDIRKLQLNYYLEDDSVELLAANDSGGRESGAKILVRQRCPRAQDNGAFANNTMLNHINNNASQHLTFGVKMETGYVTADDFTVGEYINIHGRNIFIFDCDTFTRKYYTKEGRDQPTGIDADKMFNIIPPKQARPRPPPHDGIGSEEDSLASWQNLLLKPPPRDHKKWIENAGKNLLIGLRMVRSPNAVIEEEGRHFILTYFLEDNTLQIDEVAIRNSGILSGKYLSRQKVKRVLPNGVSAPYTAEDFRIGEIVSIWGKQFEVVEYDARTHKLLNGIEDETPIEEVKMLVVKLKEALNMKYYKVVEAFRAMASGGNGSVDVDELMKFYKSINLNIRRTDAKTILNMFDTNGNGVLDYNEFVKMMEGDSFSTNLDELSLNTKGVKVDPNSTFTLRQKYQVDHIDDAHQGNVDRRRQRILLQLLRNKVSERRICTTEVFRLLNGVSMDSRMYPAEFRLGMRDILHIILSDEEQQILCDIFFPGGQPCTAERFCTIMEDVPITLDS